MYVVIVEFTIKRKDFDSFVTRVGQQAEDSLKLEADCHQFDVCVSPEQADRVLLYEIYSDRKAFDAHLASMHFQAFNNDVQDWVSDKQVSTYVRVQNSESDTGI